MKYFCYRALQIKKNFCIHASLSISGRLPGCLQFKPRRGAEGFQKLWQHYPMAVRVSDRALNAFGCVPSFPKPRSGKGVSYSTVQAVVHAGKSFKNVETKLVVHPPILILSCSSNGGGDSTIPPPWMSPKQTLPGMVLHDPLHCRQACPELNSFHRGVDQTCPREGLFRAPPPPLPKVGNKFRASCLHSLNDSFGARYPLPAGLRLRSIFKGTGCRRYGKISCGPRRFPTCFARRATDH